MRVTRLLVLLFAASCGGSPPPPPALEPPALPPIASAPAPPPPASAVSSVVAPPANSPGVRILVGGDSRDDTAHVIPWAFREAHERGAAAFVFLGDMMLTPQIDKSFAKELALLDPIPFYPVLGNHEIRVIGLFKIGQDAAERAFARRFLGDARTPVRSSLTDKGVYSVDLPGGVHFVALDNVSQKGFGPSQLAWLESDLAKARSGSTTKHIIVGMHKPLAHNGVTRHSMDADGVGAVSDSERAMALFVQSHVEIIFASHLHQYSEFQQSGIRSYITGGLGAPLTQAGPDHSFHHFLQVDVADDGLHVTTVRFGGPPAAAESDKEEQNE
jgi:3',5'-cyclic AMP phosphodiesterase CpdA